MSVYDSIREGLESDWRKARAYDHVRNLLTEILHKKAGEIGYSLSQEIINCLNNTPSSLPQGSDGQGEV